MATQRVFLEVCGQRVNLFENEVLRALASLPEPADSIEVTRKVRESNKNRDRNSVTGCLEALYAKPHGKALLTRQGRRPSLERDTQKTPVKWGVLPSVREHFEREAAERAQTAT